MPVTRLIVMNPSGGAFTSIAATIPARRVEIREDEATGNAPQGLIYQKPDDNFTNSYTVSTPGPPDQPQIVLGNVIAHAGKCGALVGVPAYNSGGAAIPASTYIKIQSKSTGGQKIRVVEYE